MSEIAERYRRRADAFEAKVAAVRPGQWENRSPCEKWTARDVVRHVVEMHEVMLRPLGLAPTAAPSVDEHPLEAFRAARADVESLLADPELRVRQVEMPMGPLTVEQNVDRVASEDLPLHGWDLARATGQDDTIHPQDVELAWKGLNSYSAEVIEKFRTPGAYGPDVEVFGPEVKVPKDASPQDRLLGFLGRDPGWRP